MASSSDIARELALAAGDLHGNLMQALNAYFKLSQSDRATRGYDALRELQQQEIVTEEETAHLKVLLETIRSVRIARPQVAERVQQVYNALLQAKAGPVALAVAGIALNSSRVEASLAASDGRTEPLEAGGIGAADCEGGIIGATVGAAAALATKSPEFVLAGALGGAAAGSLAAWLSE